jgi:hypothetical protein
MGRWSRWTALGAFLILSFAGWTGFQVAGVTDRIPGRAFAFTLVPQERAESPNVLAFAVIGDFGTGGRNQFRVAEEMIVTYWRQPYSLMLTTGDNVYFGDPAERAEEVIYRPYGPLFDAGVQFRPALGNHDVDDPEDLPETLATLGMPGRYYRFTSGPVDFFALDSNLMDGDQLMWLMEGLSCSDNAWQVVYMHHSLYSSGAHGSDTALRERLEPILIAGGADIVFSGHDHNYERSTPQDGIVHVVTGGGGRRIRPVGASAFTVVSESELHFMLVEASRDTMEIQALDTDGIAIDSFSMGPREAPASCTEAKELKP